MIEKILVVRQDRVGDVVLMTPLLESLRNIFPKAFIAVYVREAVSSILKNNPHINEIIFVNENIYKSKKELFKESLRLRKYHFTKAIIPLPEKEIAYLTFLSAIPKRFTFSRKPFNLITFSKILNKSYNPPRHEFDYMMDFARLFDKNISSPIPKIYLTDDEINKSKNILIEIGIDISKPIIGINPGSGGSVPNWSLENYLKLTEKLSNDFQIIVNIGSNELELKNEMSKIKNKNIFIVTPKLRDLILICSNLKLLVSSSTGTMHIAAALGTSTLTFYCPLKVCSPKVWGALGNFSTNIVASETFCNDICINNSRQCTLSEISVESVYQNILNLVN